MSNIENENASAPVTSSSEEMITCLIDGKKTHSIFHYLKTNYPHMTLAEYEKTYPGTPVLSAYAERLIKAKKEEKNSVVEIKEEQPVNGVLMKPFFKVFDLPETTLGVKKKNGQDIMIKTLVDLDPELCIDVPEIDQSYVFDIPKTKDVMIGFEFGYPIYLWGMHGTGKTTLLEQICAHTGRPFSRVQHTANTEESNVVGQYVVRNGSTEFQLGPLPLAMMNGAVYCADEYDIAPPSVSSVYQSVLEGKSLVIKEAPLEFRVIHPHPNFRFVATGNTNGGGDETGLYNGTIVQNAANYSRFGIVIEVLYMDAPLEINVLMSQAKIDKTNATKFVEFANSVRGQFRDGNLSTTISTRELITSAEIGIIKGLDWSSGLELGFTNRLNKVDKQIADSYKQRLFG